MKSVLISIQPKWCELIANGKKTVEVRKTRPKLETPFKVYIYCTNTKTLGDFILCKSEETAKLFGYNTAKGINKGFAQAEDIQLKGKVIGEFVCDFITNYEAELWDDETFERIQEFYEPEDFNEYGEYEFQTLADNSDDFWKEQHLCKVSCVSIEELRKYLGLGIHKFYGWHVSDLVIYDKPKELSEFYIVDEKAVKQCDHRERIYQNPDFTNGAWLLGSYVCNKDETDWCKKCKTKPLTRPPQSWCYVEEKE